MELNGQKGTRLLGARERLVSVDFFFLFELRCEGVWIQGTD